MQHFEREKPPIATQLRFYGTSSIYAARGGGKKLFLVENGREPESMNEEGDHE